MSSMFARSKNSLAVPVAPSTPVEAPTSLERALLNYSDKLDQLVRGLSAEVDVYRRVVAARQFNVLELEHIFNWAMGGIGVINLSNYLNQLCVFDRMFFSCPTTTTSIQVVLGREKIPLSFAAGSPFSNTLPIQFILGGGDTVTATITPVPTAVSGSNAPAWCFGLFGHKSGNIQEI